jgi:small GTP-binding protein
MIRVSASAARSTFRVVLIGDSSVGKTSVMNRFLRNSVNPQESPTIGALPSSFTRECRGRVVEVELWDTAGQEEYRGLGPIYYRNASLALVVFDVGSSETFASVPFWVSSFRSVAGDQSPFILVGNKTDLEDRQVQGTDAKSWAAQQGVPYYEASAKTGAGVREVFEAVVRVLADRAPIIQREALPIAEAKTKACC